MIECRNLLATLNIYEQASGQKLNHEKTSLFLSTNTEPHNQRAICIVLHTKSTDDLGKCLGLPHPPLLGGEKNKLSWRLNRRLRKKASWLERKIIVTGGEGNLDQVSGSGDPRLHDELLSSP